MTALPATPFRGHRSPIAEQAAYSATSEGPPRIHAALIAEWARLCSSPAASAPMRRWIAEEDILTGCTDIGSVLDRIDAADAGEADAILNALVRLYRNGHQLAGRVALQAMLPKLIKMSERGTAHHEVEERRHCLIASFWAVLSKERAEGGKVAAGLALDALHHTTQAKPRVDERPLQLSDNRLLNVSCNSPDPSEAAAALDAPNPDDALDAVAWGVQRGAISAADAELLTRVYLHSGGSNQLQYGPTAAALGLRVTAVRKRCSRATQALAAAVRRDIEHGDAPLASLSVAG